MVLSPSWAANWFASSQEIPRISRNPKVHYRTHKLPPPVSILVQPNPVHIPTSQLLKIRPNIIHPSTPRSLQWSPSFRFPQQDPIHPNTAFKYIESIVTYIIIIKANEMHYFAPLFSKEPYMFRIDLMSSSGVLILHSQLLGFVILVMLTAC